MTKSRKLTMTLPLSDLRRETSNAILVRVDADECWLPLSQIKVLKFANGTLLVELPAWLADDRDITHLCRGAHEVEEAVLDAMWKNLHGGIEAVQDNPGSASAWATLKRLIQAARLVGLDVTLESLAGNRFPRWARDQFCD